MAIALREALNAPNLEVMNFLNEVVMRYPDAISFAPGRPAESLFDVAESFDRWRPYVEAVCAESGLPAERVLARLGQYGKTNGVINGQIARHLELDHGVKVTPEAIMVTCGCQEAMAILLMGLFDPGRDVLLVSDPTYIGITGLAQILGVTVVPVEAGADGLEPEAVRRAVGEVEASGRRARAVYEMPDFNNPLGTLMPLANRQALTEVAREHDLLIFEDNPYGMFSYDGEPPPLLKALDQQGEHEPRVIYLGTVSKTLFPGLRLGYLVADQEVLTAAGPRLLALELSRIKSLTTVNTPHLCQAVVGGILHEEGGSLQRIVDRKLGFYRRNRDLILECLEEAVGGHPNLRGKVRWNRPAGGFFLTVDLPFEFDEACLTACAEDYGVICCPMSFFAIASRRERQIRLSFSYLSEQQIRDGIRQLAAFLATKVAA